MENHKGDYALDSIFPQQDDQPGFMTECVNQKMYFAVKDQSRAKN